VPQNHKFAVLLADGLAVEAVWYPSGTLCLSTQVGCALRCPFCASGANGLRRNLTTDELWLQVELARQCGHTISRLTLSGIGEPLHNLATVASFVTDCHRQGLPVSLTTTGAPPERFLDLLALPHNGVMLSLHAGTSATHRLLIPHGPDLDTLWPLFTDCLDNLSRRSRRRIGINYLLLRGINDTPNEIAALCERLRHWPDLTLHLLTLNPVPGSNWRSPESEAIAALHKELTDAGLNVRRANRWRQQQEGGCGTLVAACVPQESGVRSQESGVRSQESGVRSQESGVRSQESGVRSQESGIRNQESGIRNQESGIRNQIITET